MQKIESGMTVTYWDGKSSRIGVVRTVYEQINVSDVVVNGRIHKISNNRLDPKLPNCLQENLQIGNPRQIDAIKHNKTTLNLQERQKRRDRKELNKKEIEESQLSFLSGRRF
jgi:hypothetical protein